MIKPLSPKDIKPTLPEEVISAFNKILKEEWNGTELTIKQRYAVEKVIVAFAEKGKVVTSSQIYDKHWLDVEEIYRKAGWKVVYDKPAYCETYEAYFKFSKK